MASVERIKLAQEIHDGIAQDLIGVGYSLDLMLASPEINSTTRKELRTLRFTVSELIDKVRREMYQLRKPLGSTLSQELLALNTNHRFAFDLETRCESKPLDIPLEYEYEILRIAGELLQNIARHSGATSATLSLAQNPDSLNHWVTDNGIGIETAEQSNFGLAGVRERANTIHAEFTIESTDAGTVAHLRVPSAK